MEGVEDAEALHAHFAMTGTLRQLFQRCDGRGVTAGEQFEMVAQVILAREGGNNQRVGAVASNPGKGNSRIIDLRLRLARTATPAQAQADLPKLVDLAKKVDLSSL